MTEPGARDENAWGEINQLYLRIGHRQLRKAILLARKGEIHPDAEVAAQCLKFARLVLSARRRYESLDGSLARQVGAFLLGVATFGFVDYFAAWVREKSMIRDAKAIVDVY